jgi:multiple sugar transport system substrate-binding protein
MSKKLNRRDFLRLGSMAAAGGMIAACTPKATEAPAAQATKAPATAAPTPEPEGIEIQYWVFWGQLADVYPLWQETDELAEALGNNTLDFRTSMGGDTALTAVAAGTPPDIGGLGFYLDFMARGAVIPIDDWIATSSVISEENFLAPTWKLGHYQGKQYGFPAHEGFVRRALNYNARMVEAVGLDPDDPPVTFEEAFEWHKKLTKFDDAGNVLQIGLDPYDAEGGTGPGNDGFGLADFWGFEYFDPETKKFNLNNPGMAEGLEMMGEFIKFAGPDNLQSLRSVEGQGTWGGAFNAEVQAMIIEGYWHPGETVHEFPEVAKYNRATWVPVPESRRGAKIQTGGGHVAQFFKDAKHQKEAWPLAEFLQTNACCDAIFNTIGWLPAYTPYLDSADQTKFPGVEFYFKSIKEATEWYGPIVCEIEQFVQTKFVELRESVYREDMTGAEAAEKLQAAAEEEWEAAGFG